MTTSNRGESTIRAEAEYAKAVAQAQAVPSGYTRRQVERADKARKLAALPMWKRVVPSIVVVGLILTVVVSCNTNAAADRAEVERCSHPRTGATSTVDPLPEHYGRRWP